MAIKGFLSLVGVGLLYLAWDRNQTLKTRAEMDITAVEQRKREKPKLILMVVAALILFGLSGIVNL